MEFVLQLNSTKIYAFQCTFCFEKFHVGQNLEQRLLGHYYGKHVQESRLIIEKTKEKTRRNNELNEGSKNNFLEMQIKTEPIEFVSCSSEPELTTIKSEAVELPKMEEVVQQSGSLSKIVSCTSESKSSTTTKSGAIVHPKIEEVVQKSGSKIVSCSSEPKSTTIKSGAIVHPKIEEVVQKSGSKIVSCSSEPKSTTIKSGAIVHPKIEEVAQKSGPLSNIVVMQKILQCKKCQKYFIDQNTLQKHNDRDHSSRKLDIKITKLEATSTDVTPEDSISLNQNYKNKEYKCYVCKEKFLSCETLKEHRVIHYKEGPRIRKTEFKCEFCDEVLKSVQWLKHHRKQHVYLTCDLCDKKFFKQEQLNAHKNRQHVSKKVKMPKMTTSQENLDEDSQISYNCKFCNISFESKLACLSHEWLHVFNIEELKKNGAPYLCQYCDEYMPNIQTLKSHYTKCHDPNGPVGHVCPVCGKVVSSKGYLQAHIKTHEDIKEYQCDICKEMFKTKATIQLHVMTHTHDGVPKKYHCNLCPAKFTSLPAVKYHRLSHTGERKYPCTVCNIPFKCKPHLNHHMQIHTGVRHFHCKPCGKAYTSNTSRKKHNLSVHGIAKSTIPLNKIETNLEAKD